MFYEACESASFIATVQSLYTDFKYLSRASKLIAERDELLRKNKELSRQLKIYEGMRKYFNSEVSKLETDK